MNMLALTIILPLIGFVLLAFSRGRWSENVSAIVGVGSVGLAAGLHPSGDGPGYGVHPPAPGGLALDPVSPAGNGKIRQKSARSTWLRALETVKKGLRLF